MTGELFADYSFADVDLHKVKASGYSGILRYLSDSPGKNLHPAERDLALSLGLSIGLVWENSGNAATMAGGHAQGATDARKALALASSLGVPSDVALYFAVDYDAAPSACEAYFDGVHSVLGARAGMYGKRAVGEFLKSRGLVSHFWQTEAWGGQEVSPAADLYQRIGHAHAIGGVSSSSYDEDVQVGTNAALWGGPRPAPAPAPKPAPKKRPAPKPTASAVLKRGDSGASVRALQVALNSKGLARLAADGAYGPNTEAAVRSAQRLFGVTADGVFGPATAAKLAAYKRPEEPTLQEGAHGPAVSRLQALLRIRADGVFGPVTRQAVRYFQETHKLTVDGVVGPRTWAALS